MNKRKWQVSEDTKYSRYKEWYLVDGDGEITAKVQAGNDTFHFNGKEYISEIAAKIAAEKAVGFNHE